MSEQLPSRSETIEVHCTPSELARWEMTHFDLSRIRRDRALHVLAAILRRAPRGTYEVTMPLSKRANAVFRVQSPGRREATVADVLRLFDASLWPVAAALAGEGRVVRGRW